MLLDMSVNESSSELCDLELSYSCLEFKMNYLESRKAITPFLCKTDTSETDADITSSSEDNEEEDGSERVRNTKWYNMNYSEKLNGSYFSPYSILRCTCGLCVAMPTAAESICCADLKKIQGKKEEEEVYIASQHPGFQSVCLDVLVLQTAYFSLQQHYGKEAPQGTVQQYVLIVSSFIVRYLLESMYCLFSNLGSIDTQHTGSWSGGAGAGWGKVRVQLPSCTVAKIRNTFPSKTYTGFKYPTLN